MTHGCQRHKNRKKARKKWIDGTSEKSRKEHTAFLTGFNMGWKSRGKRDNEKVRELVKGKSPTDTISVQMFVNSLDTEVKK